MPTDEERRAAAIKRLKIKRAFGQHAVTYVVVNVFLIGVWAVTGAGYFWPMWVLGGWGIGLAMHAWDTFGRRGITEDDIRREIERGGDTIG